MTSNCLDYVLLGKNIKKYRNIAGFRQSDLAKLCDCSTEQIEQIEDAKAVPSLELTALIARILSVTLNQLVYGNGENSDKIHLDALKSLNQKFRG